MMDSPVPLVPDEQHQPEQITVGASDAAPTAPYALAAACIALTALLVSRAVLLNQPAWVQVGGALILGVICFALLVRAGSPLPLVPLNMLATELGLLYSLPNNRVFINWHDFTLASGLGMDMVAAALVGFILARLLRVEEAPAAVITFSFLLLFVLVNLHFLIMPISPLR